MIRHRFQVSIFVEDDDQTDPEEFLVGHIREILEKRFAKECEEFGTFPWPIRTEVRYLLTHYVPAPKQEEANGKGCEDQGSKEAGKEE